MGQKNQVQGVVNGNKVDKGSPNGRPGWNVNKEVIDNIRRSVNKFSALIDNPDKEGSNVDVNELIVKENDGGEVVPYLTKYMDFKIASWNVRGLGKISKQNVVKNLIFNEKLSICAILESRLKGSKVKRIGDKVFSRWSWLDNGLFGKSFFEAFYIALTAYIIQHTAYNYFLPNIPNAHVCKRGCRIMVGWESSKIHCMMIHTSDQAMLCLVEILSTRERLLCTFIHAKTVGRLRRQLWADLSTYKSICNNNPWVLMGDVNVSLNFEDHFEGMSYKNQHMEEFQDSVNNLKIDDISSTGLHYTWTKSLLNPNASVLKKIDRFIGNEEFFDVHRRAHVVFLPRGFAMFNLVKKLKAMKLVMNNLNWKNGNLIDKVKKLKKELDEVQMNIDKDPQNGLLREQGVAILQEYSIALKDEEKLMFQRAKVEWLNDGDRHFAFFHKVIKGEVSNDEIKDAMYSIDDNKAPGPDGYTIKFYKKAWNIIGGDVCNVVKEFFRKRKLLGELNATLITLVPKLFTIVMEVFNLIIKQKISEEANFKYHFGCKKLKITHLCFADDLLVMVMDILLLLKLSKEL
ncbi:RNA-directed DNA polymerase, eukaryota, reverse transcriptase zinc-binding domain protein [Tanacetum coccineum]